MNDQLMAALNARDDQFKGQLEHIGQSIGYGRAIQILGQLWDDMLQAKYPGAGRHQEGMRRRTDIERIEAGLPIARQVVYYQKRGRKGQITSLVPHDFVIENVARIVSDTPLFGRIDATSAADAKDAEQTLAARDVLAERRRQVEVDGHFTDRDDNYSGNDLARAAACYALADGPDADSVVLDSLYRNVWPWDACHWKPKSRRRNLVKAGALILAEIERLDRAAVSHAADDGEKA